MSRNGADARCVRPARRTCRSWSASCAGSTRNPGSPWMRNARRPGSRRCWPTRAWGACGSSSADSPAAGYIVVTFVFAMEYSGMAAVVDDFYVRPEARGQGLGKAALAEVRRACLELGARAVRVEVGVEQPRGPGRVPQRRLRAVCTTTASWRRRWRRRRTRPSSCRAGARAAWDRLRVSRRPGGVGRRRVAQVGGHSRADPLVGRGEPGRPPRTSARAARAPRRCTGRTRCR